MSLCVIILVSTLFLSGVILGCNSTNKIKNKDIERGRNRSIERLNYII